MSRVTFGVGSGISTIHGIESAVTQLGDGQIRDVKIFDGDSLFVLWELSGELNLSIHGSAA